MKLTTWQCRAIGCSASADGVGDGRGLIALGWRVIYELGSTVSVGYCPAHRCDGMDPEEVSQVAALMDRALVGAQTHPVLEILHHSNDKAAQLARLKGAPSLVLFLVQDVGAWVIGSRAGFLEDRIRPDSDWDLLVPHPAWGLVAGALPLERVVATRRGGWRVRPLADEPVIDVFPGDIGVYMTNNLVHVAWHPKSGVVWAKV